MALLECSDGSVLFQINVCKSGVESPDEQWNEMQCGVDRLLGRGVQEL